MLRKFSSPNGPSQKFSLQSLRMRNNRGFDDGRNSRRGPPNDGGQRRGPPPGFSGGNPRGPPPGFGGGDPRGPPPGFGGGDPRGPPPGFGYGGGDPRGPPPGFGGGDPRGPPPGFGGGDPRGPLPGFGYGGGDPRGPPPGFGGGNPRGPPPGFGGGDPRGPPPGFGGGDPRGPPPGFGGGNPRGPPPGFGGGDPRGDAIKDAEPSGPPEPPKRPEQVPQHIELTEREDGVVIISLKTGKVNALSCDAITEIVQWVHFLGNCDTTKGIFLRSSLDAIFCAGFDLKEFLNAETFDNFWSSVQECWMLLASFPKTIIAEINGHAVGGGCILAMTADYRIMLQGEGRIGFPESKFGLTVPPWVINHFTSIVGQRVAERMLQLGELVDAEYAVKIGLVDKVVANIEELRASGEEIMQKFLSIPEQGKWMTKDMARRELFRFLAEEDDRQYDLAFFSKFVQHPDVKNKIQAHLDSLKKKE